MQMLDADHFLLFCVIYVFALGSAIDYTVVSCWKQVFSHDKRLSVFVDIHIRDAWYILLCIQLTY